MASKVRSISMSEFEEIIKGEFEKHVELVSISVVPIVENMRINGAFLASSKDNKEYRAVILELIPTVGENISVVIVENSLVGQALLTGMVAGVMRDRMDEISREVS